MIVKRNIKKSINIKKLDKIIYLGNYKYKLLNNDNYDIEIYIIKNIDIDINFQTIEIYDKMGYMIITDFKINNFTNKKDLLLINNDIIEYLYKNNIDLDNEIAKISDEIVDYYLDNLF